MRHLNPNRRDFELTMRCASASLSRMKHTMSPALLAATLFALVSATAPAQAKITVAQCEADYAAMLAEIEANREHSLAELNSALRLTSDKDTAAALSHQIEQTYHMEEDFRGHAAIAYRDCLKYAKGSGS